MSEHEELTEEERAYLTSIIRNTRTGALHGAKALRIIDAHAADRAALVQDRDEWQEVSRDWRYRAEAAETEVRQLRADRASLVTRAEAAETRIGQYEKLCQSKDRLIAALESEAASHVARAEAAERMSVSARMALAEDQALETRIADLENALNTEAQLAADWKARYDALLVDLDCEKDCHAKTRRRAEAAEKSHGEAVAAWDAEVAELRAEVERLRGVIMVQQEPDTDEALESHLAAANALLRRCQQAVSPVSLLGRDIDAHLGATELAHREVQRKEPKP